MLKRLIVLIFIVFGLGWLSHLLYGQLSNNNAELPISDLLEFSAKERASPYDWVKENQITISKDNISIDIQNPQWAIFTNTNSMDPIIDETSHAIQVIPQKEEDIHVGDIISFASNEIDGIVIHRVVDIGNDGEWYALTKGDNNTMADPQRVRFTQIERVLVAIIY